MRCLFRRIPKSYLPKTSFSGIVRKSGRVIFLAAPLRGSNLARSWIGRIGASLVRAPRAFREAVHEALRVTDVKEGELKLKRLPNSVDTLAPQNHSSKIKVFFAHEAL